MKLLSIVLLGAMALGSSTYALAGRDAAQLKEQERAIKALQMRQLAQQTRAQKGLAGAVGVPGKAGPSGPASRARRLPGEHP